MGINFSVNEMAIEEPQYDLINKTHSYEIRMYKERLAAQTIKTQAQIGRSCVYLITFLVRTKTHLR